MKSLVVGLITLGVVSSTTIALADGVIIPRSVRVEAFKQEMKKQGYNFYGGDDADGEVQNGGTQIKVITYRSADEKILNIIRDSAVKTVRE